MKHFAPATMSELYGALAEMTPQSKIISGGSDLILRLRMGLAPDALLYMGGVAELSAVERRGDQMVIGAMATMTQIAGYPHFPRALMALPDAAADVGSKQIRNSGTIGGNVGNASAAGDLIPVLFLLHARVEIACPDGSLRTVPIEELVVGPMKTTLATGEAIVRFLLPIPQSPTQSSAFLKLGSRKSLTISRIGLGISADRGADGSVSQVEVVAGAVSLTPVHVKEAEAWLPGRQLDATAAREVGRALSDLILAITPEKFDRDYKVGAAWGVAEDVLAILAGRFD